MAVWRQTWKKNSLKLVKYCFKRIHFGSLTDTVVNWGFITIFHGSRESRFL